jgi:hypothetical protein
MRGNEGSVMKKHHLFAFYATLLVPVGALAGLAVGQILGSSAALVVIGAIFGLAAAHLVQRRATPDETP